MPGHVLGLGKLVSKTGVYSLLSWNLPPGRSFSQGSQRKQNSLPCPSPTSHHSSSQEALRRSFLEEGCVCVCLWSTTQSCLTLCDPMDCSAPGSSVHRIFHRNTGVGCHFLLQGIFPIQGWNQSLLHLLHWQVDSFPLAPPRKPFEEV